MRAIGLLVLSTIMCYLPEIKFSSIEKTNAGIGGQTPLRFFSCSGRTGLGRTRNFEEQESEGNIKALSE